MFWIVVCDWLVIVVFGVGSVLVSRNLELVWVGRLCMLSGRD
jgi:hypothetical protein